MNRDTISVRTATLIATAAVAADIFFVWWSPNFDVFVLFLFVVPITVLIFIVLAVRDGKKSVLRLGIALLVFLAATYAIAHYRVILRAEIRWWSARETWKQRVLSQEQIPGQLKHLDWDGWGMIGQDTEVYLVYDPADRLREATDIPGGRHGTGLPCDVWKIQRIQPNWYNVVFFTDTSWDSCS